MSTIKILLADDHGIVRKGLRFLMESEPELQVIAEASDGREAVMLAHKLSPDIVIMDIAMPILNGIDATAQIVKQNSNVGVIILSMHSDEGYILRTLSSGAKGYLLKGSAELDLIRAVHSVSRGKPFFSPELTRTLLDGYLQGAQAKGVQDSYDLLTDREKEVLQLLAEGKTNKQVAALLNLSVYTVDTHRANLMQKLDLHNTADIILYAVRKKIIV